MDFGNSLRQIPPVTRNLLIINIGLYLIGALFPNFGNLLTDKLGLHMVDAPNFNPVQPITYMFLHGGFWHLIFNMFTLWMFGRVLESVWGSRRFFIFYMVCGIGAAIVQEAVWMLTFNHEYISQLARQNGLTYNHMAEVVNQALASGNAAWEQGYAASKAMFVTVGASGAIFGLLLGFAFIFPNMPMYIYFIPIPIKAKYMVIGYAVLEFFLGVSGAGGPVAHFAHLGGLLFALIMLLYWKKKGTLNGGRYY